MSDFAFNWPEMESNLKDSEYSQNFLHAEKINFTEYKDRHPENIWVIRKKDLNYWLIGRLSVDLNSKTLPSGIKKDYWITFNPEESVFYSNPLEVQKSLEITLNEICKKIFSKGNGIGANAATLLSPSQEKILKNADANNSKVSYHEFREKMKLGQLVGYPYLNVKNSTQKTKKKISDTHPISDEIEISISSNNSSESGSSEITQISNFRKNMESVLSDLGPRMPGEDIDAFVKRRVGQSLFRDLLVSQHGSSCHISQMNNRRLLIASHIVPWSKSTGDEKTDPDNGLLLAANWDAVFDKGLITFNSEGKTIFSKALDDETQAQLGIKGDFRLRGDLLTPKRLSYLDRHRNEFLEREMLV